MENLDQHPALKGPTIDPNFERELNQLVSLAKKGQKADSPFYNPPNEWLISRMRILQDLPPSEQQAVLEEAARLATEIAAANSQGKAATRAWPEVVFRLETGGLDFFSQLGVARRPDLTQYFVDGFAKNRDAHSFNEANQALFAEVLPYINRRMEQHFAAGDGVIQLDRQIGDEPSRAFHARQLVFGDRYLQMPYMWRQLTFDLPPEKMTGAPDILEVSLPRWLDDLGLPDELKGRVRESGLTQLVFKAPTKGLSLHLGFDYVGEHKMGPLSIAMFLVKEQQGLAVQAALSVARIRALDGSLRSSALVTVGPSLHGKSTLTVMIEPKGSELGGLLGLSDDPEEGVYPMNDDIVLLRPMQKPVEVKRNGRTVKITHAIDGTENNLYAVPSGLTYQDDPVTHDVLRGTPGSPNPQETLENVPVNVQGGSPNFLENPVRNMRMALSRPRLLARKGADHLLESITQGHAKEGVHVPMEWIDRVLWQAVMRQNTVIPALRRLTLEQYIRVLMYGEAVQMGAAAGAIGRPYVEYFSDPFIIGLEDENANVLHDILTRMAEGGLPQEYYVFNTGGLGADTNDEASGKRYKKIPRELTLMLQEALLREAVKFEHDSILGSDIAVAIVDSQGKEIVDLRGEWSPRAIYGDDEYRARVEEVKRRRYYGRDSSDKAGILRYTKVSNPLINLADIPPPANERELSWLLSFYWSVDQACDTLAALIEHLSEGQAPKADFLKALVPITKAAIGLPPESQALLAALGLTSTG
ncbi:MAG: Phosphoenolpyruvate carboxykinase, ATP-dependent [Chloroflexi bacterium]|jgi:hypothetical protein|nr:MAG: Phosphoenolpyruvate carboxykinase, ATP-dependent [Chloroflexota bacterium]